MAEYAHLSTPHPELAEDLKALAQVPIPKDYATIRESAKNVGIPKLVKMLEPDMPPGMYHTFFLLTIEFERNTFHQNQNTILKTT